MQMGLVLWLGAAGARDQDCSAFLDSLRAAYHGDDPAFLAWTVDNHACSEAQAQEAFYLQGMGFAALRRLDLAAASWRRALVLHGPRREEILFRLWKSARAQGDSLQAAAYAVLLHDEFSDSPYLGRMDSPEPLPEDARRAGASKKWYAAFSTQNGLLSSHSPSYSRDFFVDRAQVDEERRRGRSGIRFSATAEMDTRLRTGLPAHPDSFFTALPQSGWDLFSADVAVRAHYEGWYSNLGAGQLYDFEAPMDQALPPEVVLSKGWVGPTWSATAGYLGFVDGALDWFGSYQAGVAQLRRDWMAYSANSEFSHLGAHWRQVAVLTGAWNAIALSGPIPGLPESPSYSGFESLEFSLESMLRSGPHRPGLKFEYAWQRDRYSGPDVYNVATPGVRQDLDLTGEYEYRLWAHSSFWFYAGGGYELNHATGNPSGPIFRFGAFFRWGD